MKSLPRATSSSNSKRLQRRISADFVPIFDDNLSDFDHLNTNQLTPQTKTKIKSQKFVKSLPRISSLPRSRKARIQPQRRDYRTHYRVIKQSSKHFWVFIFNFKFKCLFKNEFSPLWCLLEFLMGTLKIRTKISNDLIR